MDEKLLRKLAGKYQTPLGTLEKDYALTNLLSVIANFPKLDKIVFKGGTALKKIHFEDFRFSGDLDFVCFEDVSNDFMDFIKNNMGNLDVEFTEISNIEKKDESFKFKVKYNQSTGARTSIKVDLNLHGDVILEYPTKPILHFYETFQTPFSVPVMTLEEIMAEKIRAIIYTKHPRHLYDIQYLHHQGIKINSDMVRTKIKSVYNEDFDLDKLKERLPEKAKDWITDLRPLLPIHPPSFDDVSKEVLEVITNAMK